MVFEQNILRLRSNSQIRLRDFDQQKTSGGRLNLRVEAQTKGGSVIHRAIASPKVTASKTGTGMRVLTQFVIQAPDPAAIGVAGFLVEEAVMRLISQ